MTDMPPAGPDRLNNVVTTALDTLAILAVTAGMAVTLAARFGWGPAMLFSGIALGLLSAAAQFTHRPRRRRRPAPAAAPPGPEHPGTVHVSGR